MDRISPLARIAIPLALLAAGAAAQDAARSAPQKIDGQALLQKAIQKMSRLNSVKFKTTESQDSATTRRIMKQMAGMGGAMGAPDTVVRGGFSDNILHAKLNDGDNEVVMYRGRMVARGDNDEKWKLRRNRLQNGKPLPFVLDPNLFFEVLAQLPKSALHVKHVDEQDTTKGKRVVLGITLDDDDARDFALSGTMPAIQAGGFGGMLVRMGAIGGAGGGGAGAPDITLDLAFTIDPTTGFVHRIRSASYQEGGGGGGARIMIGGAGGGFGEEEEEEEEEEEVKTRDAKGKRIYKRGLPVRKLGDSLSKMRFDITFQKHGQPYVVELDEAGRKLLRLATGK